MKSNWIIIVGAFLILPLVVYLFVFKSSASQDLTYVEGCIPFNVEIKKGREKNSVDISWKSKEECSSYILYGKEMRGLEMVGVDLVNDTQSKEHTVTITSLVSTRKYYFAIVSNGVSYGKEGLPLQFSIDSL